MNLKSKKHLHYNDNEVTVDLLKKWFEIKEHFSILDVRESWELKKASFDEYNHIRICDIQNNLDIIDKSKKTLIICHHGRRSLGACYYLRDKGFEKTLYLKGGINMWATHIDINMKRY